MCDLIDSGDPTGNTILNAKSNPNTHTHTHTHKTQTQPCQLTVPLTSSVGVLDFSDQDLVIKCVLQLLLQLLDLRLVAAAPTSYGRM